MKHNHSITRKFFNGVKIEICFERYAIQFDDGQWKSIVQIESLDGKSIPGIYKTFKEIVVEADKVDTFDSVEDFAFDYLSALTKNYCFKTQKLPISFQSSLF